MNKSRISLLKQVLSQPTAPFREDHVVALVCQQLERCDVPFFFDETGNIVIGARSQQHYIRRLNQRSKEPLRVFIAHMDHPGFHGSRWLSDTQLKIKWHGGSPVRHVNGSNVWLSYPDGHLVNGKLGKATIHRQGYCIDSAIVTIPRDHFLRNHVPQDKLSSRRPAARQVYGGFDFKAPVWTSGKRIYARAADDLTGVFCILSLALDVYGKNKRRNDAPFIGLLTRAEEVGFVGAIGHFESGLLQRARRDIVCVSLEASRTLPGALIGKGPVIRLGDRRTLFNNDGCHVLGMLAQKVLPGKHQRRIMDGGSCEGTAASLYGLPVIAMTVPLGNYHNQGLDGGQQCSKPGGPAPEYVHLDDVDGELRLCHALLKPGLPWKEPWQPMKTRLQKNYQRYSRLL